MRKFLFILAFLISNWAFAQSETGIIGVSKDHIKSIMKSNNSYYLFRDTVSISTGVMLQYKLIDMMDSSILKKRILLYSFYFEKNICTGLRIMLFGEDAILKFIKKISETNNRIATNIWLDEKTSIGIRIVKMPPYNGKEIDVYQIDIGKIEFTKR